MKNTKNLICQDYRITNSIGDLVRVDASFVLDIDPRNKDLVGEAMKRIHELFFTGNGISIVAGGDKPRCTYCGTLQKGDEVICEQCGGKL